MLTSRASRSTGLIALLLRPIFEGHDQVKLGMSWQMRNVNLACRTITIELCEIFVVRRDDHCMRSHVIRVIVAVGGSMQIRNQAPENMYMTPIWSMCTGRLARLCLVNWPHVQLLSQPCSVMLSPTAQDHWCPEVHN